MALRKKKKKIKMTPPVKNQQAMMAQIKSPYKNLEAMFAAETAPKKHKTAIHSIKWESEPEKK